MQLAKTIIFPSTKNYDLVVDIFDKVSIIDRLGADFYLSFENSYRKILELEGQRDDQSLGKEENDKLYKQVDNLREQFLASYKEVLNKGVLTSKVRNRLIEVSEEDYFSKALYEKGSPYKGLNRIPEKMSRAEKTLIAQSLAEIVAYSVFFKTPKDIGPEDIKAISPKSDSEIGGQGIDAEALLQSIQNAFNTEELEEVVIINEEPTEEVVEENKKQKKQEVQKMDDIILNHFGGR